MSKVTFAKECFCHNCQRAFHYLGIARHRAAHRNKKEMVTITYTDGKTYEHHFERLAKEIQDE